MKETITVKFNESCKAYDKNHEYNKMYIRTFIQYMHDKLCNRGYLFLRDAYEYLGIPVTRNILGKGWAINNLKGIDDFMSFTYNVNGNIDIVFHNVENIVDKFPLDES